MINNKSEKDKPITIEHDREESGIDSPIRENEDEKKKKHKRIKKRKSSQTTIHSRRHSLDFMSFNKKTFKLIKENLKKSSKRNVSQNMHRPSSVDFNSS